jgi:SM-20-related protein
MDKLVANPFAQPEPAHQDNPQVLDCKAIERAPMVTEPYEFVFATNAIRHGIRSALLDDAPVISASGSILLARLNYGPVFKALVDDLQSPGFRRIVEHKFKLDLADLSTTLSVRGYVRRLADGYVHTDLADKVISVLLYLNADWGAAAGRLRVLRSRNITDYALEISPELGNMLIFRRSERSWHGHLPYEGPRLSIQLNWMRSARGGRHYWRHRLNFLKSLSPR